MSNDPSGGQHDPNQGWAGQQYPQQGAPQEQYPYQQGSSGQPYPGAPYGGGYGQQPQWGQQPPAGVGPGGYPGPPPSSDTNPFAALADFSFTKFATPGLIKLLYIVGTVLLVLFWLGAMISAFTNPFGGIGPGLLVLVLGGIGVVFYLMFLRVTLEFFYAVVRMSEDIHRQSNR